MQKSLQQVINKTSVPNRFILSWVGEVGRLPDSKIIIDFNPVIEVAQAQGNFAMWHYQAKPKGLRKYGVFCSGEYYSVDRVIGLTFCETVLAPETKESLPPNAVVLHRNSVCTVSDGVATITKG